MAGLCYCGMAVMVCVAGEWRWCDGCVVLVVSFLSFLSFFLCVLVFGVVRAQLCEHARYPRTPLCLPKSEAKRA